MKALVYVGPEQLEMRDVNDPEPVEDEVLIKVSSCGICGSDMHAYLGHDERRPAPLILGHEVAGHVVGGPLDGKLVTVNPLVTCGNCQACRTGRENLCPERQIISMPPREGGFAEIITIPASNLVEVPTGVSPERACLAEPIACGWHAARLANSTLQSDLEDSNVLVIGGGAIGVGAALSLKCFGAHNITVSEPNEIRRSFLCETTELNVTAPDAVETDSGYELVIDAVGFAETRKFASGAAKPGGVIVHIGLGAAEGGLDIRRMTLQEITFIGTYTYSSIDFRATAKAIFQGDLGDLNWAEQRPLEDGAKAFSDFKNGMVQAAKIILKPDH